MRCLGMPERCRWFFDGYLAFHPEEATTLGLSADGNGVPSPWAGRLRDHSQRGLAAERDWFEQAAGRLESDDSLDGRWLKRLVDYHLRSWDWLWCGIEWSLYPFIMIQAQLLHADNEQDRAAANQRLGAVAGFLDAHQQNMLRGMQRGIAPDGMLLSFYVNQQLPAAEASLRALRLPNAAGAADAYAAHGKWLEAEIDRDEPVRLGEEELVYRVRHMLGFDAEPELLIARARQELSETQERMIILCGRMAPARAITTFAGARDVAKELSAETLQRHAEVIPSYRAYVDRALALCRSERLFDIPDDYAIAIEPFPRGLELTGRAANWPAPLKARHKLGHFLVDPRAKSHPLGWSAGLAIHEGLPGHHLQSFCWQRRYHDDPAPVRFLMVHDQVALPRHYWAPMVNIEGWAVHAEELMRQHGLFAPREELFILSARTIHACRVICDMSFHLGRMSTDDVVAFLDQEVGLSPSWSRLEVHRYSQIPLQSSTYLLGRIAVEELERDVRSVYGSDYDAARFHDRFFAYGPIYPAMIREAMLGV